MISSTSITASQQTNSSLTPPSATLPNLSFLFSDPVAKRLNVGDNATAAVTPITTNTTFILSQLPALRAVLTQLRPKLMTLSAASTQTGEPDPKREERRQYIDSRIRLHLERSGELGNSEGVLRDRRIDEKEVQALESVIGMLEK